MAFTPEVWAEKVREVEAQGNILGLFALPEGSGTGFYIDESGTLLTAAHVVAGREALLVERFGGSDECRIEPVVVDNELDIAMLLPTTALPGQVPVLQLADRRLGVGEQVWGLCASPAEKPRFIDMRVEAVDRPVRLGSEDGSIVVRISNGLVLRGEAHEGCSGGPIVDSSGDVVGMILGAANGLTQAHSSGAIRRWVERQSRYFV